MLICLVTGNIEMSTAKCDVSQELMTSTGSSNYYSAIRDQKLCAKQTNNSITACKVSKWSSSTLKLHVFGQQNVVPEYDFPSDSYNNKEPNTLGKNYSKIACNDYEAIKNPEDYAAAILVYSDTVKGSITYDDANMPEYSEVEDIDGTTSDDQEEIYSDPGHCEADIYACFERKKLSVIEKNDVRCIYLTRCTARAS